MAWNEPGGSGDKDPWGNRKNEQGPPDLDEIIKNFQKKINGIFGGKGGGNRSTGSSGGGIGLTVILGILLVIWALSGIYIVDTGKQGVVLRFGKFLTITEPGPHWFPRFVDSVDVVDTEQVRSVNLGRLADESLMLTEDENIIDIKFTAQYKVKNPQEYLFSVRDPDLTLRQVTESSVREIVGKNKLDYVITDGRQDVAAKAEALMQKVLDDYKTGIRVVKLNMQDAQPPNQVQDAFNDAIKAREDKQRLINEAEAYANDVLPKARGKAARMIQEAEAYREEIVQRSKGESDRFLKVLAQYKKAPAVTRERLYLESMEEVLAKSNKVMMDVKQGNSLMYLPIDKLISNKSSGYNKDSTSYTPTQSMPSNIPQSPRSRDRLRSREVQ